MNRLGVKLILSIVSFLAVNIWLIGKGNNTIYHFTAISCTDIFYISSYGKKI